ncbi:Putative cellulose synthase-like protein D5 [Triticum urartu]|uniref:Putative cellulose synthase-like protein D5 n=2 Tax=Triticum urartu TaxID=4572 RepID=M7YUR4_TRIUA|nr:Putative cellulose synthase-like protein D5 [Triticum urartu]
MASDHTNYTVFMPPTPDNQPGAASAPASGGPTKPDNLPLPRSSGSKLVNRRSGDDGAAGGGKMDRRLSPAQVASPSKSLLVRSQTGEFDHNRWLFETQGTYGIGNAYWPQDDNDDGSGMGAGSVKMEDLVDKPWKPLSRKVAIPPGILSPYRLLVLVRFVALFLFLVWRATNPNPDAMWLWGISIVCEYWFALSWLLDQMPKLNPINRAADLAALREKFESKTPSNPTGRSDLPGLDVFISTADPYKEPPLVTANTLLSILATDYPVEKLFVYISDDGGALLTFEAMAEACAYAKVWVPFCRKHSIEPRNPEAYFTQKGDPTKGKKRPDFVKDRRWIKREYDEYKVRINDLPEAIKRRAKAMSAHERKIARETAAASSDAAPPPVKATWMADGTHWPGTWLDSAPDHGKGDHASIVQVMIKNPHHDVVYGDADDHAYLDFTNVDVRIPMFVYLSREKRPGYDHNKKAGAMNAMDVVTGYRMHNRGWRSVYCITKRDAFRGTAPINLTDRLHQVLRWATGSVEIFFSKNNALLASRRLMFLQRMSYINVGIYPFTSLFLIMYCLLPALSLFSGQFIVATLDPTFLCYLLLITITLVLLCLLEVKWSGIGLEEWWRNEQFWVIGGTSAHLAAVLQGLLKVAAGIEISSTLPAKAAAEDDDDPFAELYLIKWTSLFIPPLAIIGINIIAMVVGVSRCVYAEIPQYSKLLGGGFFSFWVLAHYYPFAKGLMGRRGRRQTIVYVWAGLISITVSLLWITISPPDDRVSQSGIEV